MSVNTLLQSTRTNRARRKEPFSAVPPWHKRLMCLLVLGSLEWIRNISIQRLADVSQALRTPLSVLLNGLGYQPAPFSHLLGSGPESPQWVLHWRDNWAGTLSNSIGDCRPCRRLLAESLKWWPIITALLRKSYKRVRMRWNPEWQQVAPRGFI